LSRQLPEEIGPRRNEDDEGHTKSMKAARLSFEKREEAHTEGHDKGAEGEGKGPAIKV
jgi:hypothetical protein